MATRSSTTFKKRQKEIARQEKQREKQAKRVQRKLEKQIRGPQTEEDMMGTVEQPEDDPSLEG